MASRRASFWLVVLAAFGALSSGCFLDASAYDGAGAGSGTTSAPAGGGAATGGSGTGNGGSGAGTSAGGATGGAGGATGGTTASGGTTTTTTTTGMTCSKDTDCPDPGGPCVAPKCDKGVCSGKPDNDKLICGAAMGECYDVAKCDGGACVSAPLPNGTALTDLSLGDCSRPVCDGNGNAILAPNDVDKPFSTQCADFACAGGSLLMTPKNEGQSCLAVGVCCGNGKCCDASCLVCL